MGHHRTILNNLIKSICVLSLLFIALSGCDGSKKKQQQQSQQSITVEAHTINTPLYFTGKIMPFSVQSVTAPVEGNISGQYFTFGSPVTKGQKLVTITSSKLAEDFKSDVTSFFKALDDYNTKKQKLISSKQLFKLEFISHDDYNQSITDEKESYVALTVAKLKLRDTFKRLGLKTDVEQLNFNNAKSISKFISQKQDTISIYSPSNGIATIPSKSGNSSKGGNDSAIDVGAQVKEGQTIVAIGNMHGISVEIDVNETTINQLTREQSVTVTGAAFPTITLHGKITKIQTQAKESGTGLPVFPVTIKVENLTPEQAKIIHLGMTSKVAVELKKTNVIMIPLKAVHEKEHMPYVNIKDSNTGEVVEHAISPGKTTLDSVEVKGGLNPGDIIVYDN